MAFAEFENVADADAEADTEVTLIEIEEVELTSVDVGSREDVDVNVEVAVGKEEVVFRGMGRHVPLPLGSPDSHLQDGEQPSPWRVLPSSHSSPKAGSKMPSPHLAGVAPWEWCERHAISYKAKIVPVLRAEDKSQKTYARNDIWDAVGTISKLLVTNTGDVVSDSEGLEAISSVPWVRREGFVNTAAPVGQIGIGDIRKRRCLGNNVDIIVAAQSSTHFEVSKVG